jgi:hypothetical protein
MRETFAALAVGAAILSASTASAAPISYTLSGTFDTVNHPAPGTGPFDNRAFSLQWTVADPSAPDDPFATSYLVVAVLAIDGIGTFHQAVGWALSPFGLSYGLGGFVDVLAPSDSLFFGICSGGTCTDPVLFNQDPFNPVLFTGSFPLGLDSSCAFSAPCLNAQANYFSGGTGFGTRFFGDLTVTEATTPVPEPATLTLLVLAMPGLRYKCRRRNSQGTG